MLLIEPGQLKSLGTDAFIAFDFEGSSSGELLQVECQSDEGVRSRQKFRCAEAIRCNEKVFTSFLVVGVRVVEQQPDLRSRKVMDREI